MKLDILESFYETLFRPEEGVCWSNDTYGTNVSAMNLQPIMCGHRFFCINPLHLSKDLDPVRPHHSPLVGRRADANISAFRNILVEFDEMTTQEQLDYIHKINMPYTTLVHSGGKSIHAIISLSEPLKNREEYRQVVKAVYRRVRFADLSASNPSRLSRSPNAIRDNGAKQELLFLGPSIDKFELLNFTGPIAEPTPVNSSENAQRVYNSFTQFFIHHGDEGAVGQRNRRLFSAACDMYRCGASEDEVYSRLAPKSSLEEREIKQTIDSAKRTVARGV